VGGRTLAIPNAEATVPQLTVAPGQTVTIIIKMIVPTSQQVKAFRFGIVNDENGHLNPLLASAHGLFRPGAHRFVLRWRVPAALPPGVTRQLAAEWVYSGKVANRTGESVASFEVVLPAPTTPGSASARRLRALALRTVTTCNGEAPTSILAVRTTYGKAVAVSGLSPAYYFNASQAVYLVVVKGELTFSGEVVRPSCKDLSESYFMAIVDPATFGILDDALSPYPPKESVSALGRVVNLTPRRR
jgi:hypothetical protein